MYGGKLVLMPIFLAAGTYSQLKIYVRAAGPAGAVVRAGVYDGDTLVTDWGTIPVDTTGQKTIGGTCTVPASKAYLIGLVWQGVTTGALSVSRMQAAGDNGIVGAAPIGKDDGDMDYPRFGLRVEGITGALPADLSALTRYSAAQQYLVRIRRA
jgi:hypothetical protein